jgi:hypothetical protein
MILFHKIPSFVEICVALRDPLPATSFSIAGAIGIYKPHFYITMGKYGHGGQIGEETVVVEWEGRRML